MALFGFRKDASTQTEKTRLHSKQAKKETKAENTVIKRPAKTDKEHKSTEVLTPKASAGIDTGRTSAIIRPRVTEKSGVQSQNGIYTFEVQKSANKAMVEKSFTALYKVNPVRIAIINTPVRNVFVKGRKGTVAGIKKAIVTLKKGEKIDFV